MTKSLRNDYLSLSIMIFNMSLNKWEKKEINLEFKPEITSSNPSERSMANSLNSDYLKSIEYK